MTAPSRQLAPVCIRGIYLFAPLGGRLTWTATRAPYYSYNVKPFGARAALRPANMPTTLVCCWAALSSTSNTRSLAVCDCVYARIWRGTFKRRTKKYLREFPQHWVVCRSVVSGCLVAPQKSHSLMRGDWTELNWWWGILLFGGRSPKKWHCHQHEDIMEICNNGHRA